MHEVRERRTTLRLCSKLSVLHNNRIVADIFFLSCFFPSQRTCDSVDRLLGAWLIFVLVHEIGWKIVCFNKLSGFLVAALFSLFVCQANPMHKNGASVISTAYTDSQQRRNNYQRDSVCLGHASYTPVLYLSPLLYLSSMRKESVSYSVLSAKSHA